MSDMRCPYCGGELSKRQAGTTDYANMFTVYLCDNVNCDETTDLVGCKEFWDILGQHIRAKKQLVSKCNQLEIAVDALKYANKCIKGGCVDWETEIDRALNKITALEQKDVK